MAWILLQLPKKYQSNYFKYEYKWLETRFLAHSLNLSTHFLNTTSVISWFIATLNESALEIQTKRWQDKVNAWVVIMQRGNFASLKILTEKGPFRITHFFMATIKGDWFFLLKIEINDG